MRRRADEDRSDGPIDFFVSYSPYDARWAEWIAWQLELAGYRTMLQAWDFVPGTNFIDFMDRGVREASAVIAVLSTRYVQSRYGRMEWQAALRSAPDQPDRRLITVRVEDFPIQGLLATITFVDLVGVENADVARNRLLGRIREALNGRAKPAEQPEYPRLDTVRIGPQDASPVAVGLARQHPRLRNRLPAPFPPTRPAAQEPLAEVSFLQVGDVRLGAGGKSRGRRHLDVLRECERALGPAAGRRPVHGLLISGNLTAAGGIRDFDEALNLVLGLRSMLDIPLHRVAVVPGADDLTIAACRAYFATCEADEVEPEPPYWPKWRHFARFFDDLYDGVEGVNFTARQPWSLFEMADLGVVVAGLNSTMGDSHLERHATGWLGRGQRRWFSRELQRYAPPEWFRIGLVSGSDTVLAAEPDDRDDMEFDLNLTSPPAGVARLVAVNRTDPGGPWLEESEELPIGDW
jgi:hypothetical protein